jgi:predicted nucleic acid-binding protein
MRSVVDSSPSFKWVVPEHDSPKAVRLRDDFVNGVHDLIAPDIFPVELSHALTRAERQGRIVVSEAVRLLTDVMGTSPQLFASLPLVLRACDISSRMRVGVYDCLYVALAEREGCEFLTADDRLVRALGPAFPFIVSLATLP